jgi:molybdenum cofactor cytidylyltransferase
MPSPAAPTSSPGRRGVTLDAAAIDAVNRIDEAITIATLPNHAAVTAGQMLATVKIIPFAAPEAALEAAVNPARSRRSVLRLHPYRERRARLIQTALPEPAPRCWTGPPESPRSAWPPSGLARGRVHAARTRSALARAIREASTPASTSCSSPRFRHHRRRDVLPAGIEGGWRRIEHFGMPVDPGNLMLLSGTAKPRPRPSGCARSPKLNGFDGSFSAWRPASGRPSPASWPGRRRLMTEIQTARSHATGSDREGEPEDRRLILDDGQSRRRARANKSDPRGRQALLRHTVEAALASKATDNLSFRP